MPGSDLVDALHHLAAQFLAADFLSSSCSLSSRRASRITYEAEL
ncbi:MAG TPA: hypothetical protein VIL74_14635 [Pyrinomonadaceae bacterium]